MRSRTAQVRMHSRLLGFLKSNEDAKSGMNGMPMRAIFTIRVITTSRMTLEFKASKLNGKFLGEIQATTS